MADFKATNGKEATNVSLADGREIHFDRMTDAEAVEAADGLHSMMMEANLSVSKKLASKGLLQ